MRGRSDDDAEGDADAARHLAGRRARPYVRTKLYLIIFSVDSRVFREARVRRGLWQDGDGFRMR